MKTHAILRAACMLLLSAFTLHAGVPNLINYQGRLTDAQGDPVTGNRTMVVRVYDAPSGGNMTYEETIGTVAVANGTYSFQFGGVGDGIIAVLIGFSDYLALSVNGTEESTRTRLLAVAYALRAKESADAQMAIDALVGAGLMTRNFSPDMIVVHGGVLPETSGLAGTAVGSFQIGKYEVTVGEWNEVAEWGSSNGYELAVSGSGLSNYYPISSVNWYGVVKWCNAKSEKEGLVPVYSVNGTIYRSGEFGWHGSSVVTRNLSANGYRLPTELEWEWAARGGVLSQGYTYSGSNDLGAVAWVSMFYAGAKAVGTKAANELGIHDMSGNVQECCEDLFFGVYGDGPGRRALGGSWNLAGYYAALTARGGSRPDYPDSDLGFRLARSSGL
jgi:sulfatase modifying factor 1